MMNKESKYINVKGQLMDLSEPRDSECNTRFLLQ